MNERNVINGTLASYLAWAADFVSPIRWFLLAALALVLADLKFGIDAARHRGEVIRKSRAVRRSINKVIDYICWILVATSFGQAFGTPFGIPVLPAVVLLVVYGCEINSCFNNYFEAHGSRMRINIFKWFKSKNDIIVPDEPTGKQGGDEEPPPDTTN
ncbi:phage holin family protein [Barnesiella viscericola]|uniref:Holin n=1 Tax=Barnesiella viscericola TaxID=397865 RepID=A0A921MS92_9BACT|nr:hypothetical protein [Barnesiella viscericola]HJG89713.1 hypothetical protein [Barnesiella viscericola]